MNGPGVIPDVPAPPGAPSGLTVDGGRPGLRLLRTDLHDPSQRTAVERTLTAIPGVLNARVVPGYERPVDEVHVLTSLDKAAKQAVRDVQTTLMARYGISTDHRVISVVRLDEDLAGSTAPRVAIDSVAVRRGDLEVRAEVVLRDGDDTLLGSRPVESADDHDEGDAGRLRAVADATLDAVRPLLDRVTSVDLEACTILPVHDRRVAVALVSFRTPRGHHTVSGSALVRGTETDAVARAVLDALNRSIEDANAR